MTFFGAWKDFDLLAIDFDRIHFISQLNPLVPDAHYSERQDKPFFYKFND